MDHARGKVLVARGIAIFVAILLFTWPEWAPSLATRLWWWPGNDPHNLYGLAAMVAAIGAAAGFIFALIFIPGCILLASRGTLSVGWVSASIVSMASGAFGTWASPRLQRWAVQHDTSHAH